MSLKFPMGVDIMYKPGLYSIINYILCAIVTIFLANCQTTQQIEKTIPQHIEIAIMVPLSGDSSEEGKKIAELIKLGLQQGLVTGNVNVTVYDAATKELALQSMNKIINQKTKIILGPISSQITESISNLAIINNIIVISLSNNPLIARDNILAFGHTPMKQTEKILQFLLQNGHKDFILFLPKKPNSQNIVNIIRSMLLTNHANLVHTEFYQQNNIESITNGVINIVPKVDDLNEREESLKPAIYIADESKYLPEIFNLLEQYNLTQNAIIFGDNRLNIDYKYKINAIYTGSLNIMQTSLPQILKNKFGNEFLNFLEMLAYDVGFITAQAINDNFNTTQFLFRLTKPNGYFGIAGNVRFNGFIAERMYDIIKRDYFNITLIYKAENFIKQ